MKKNMFLHIVLILVLPWIQGCFGEETDPIHYVETTATDTYTSSAPHETFYVDTTENEIMTYTLDLGTSPRDVYFIFTNISTSANARTPGVEDDGIAAALASTGPLFDAATAPRKSRMRGAPFITEFNRKVYGPAPDATDTQPRLATRPAPFRADMVGDLHTFVTDDENVSQIPASCVSVTQVSTAFGTKTLNIWVADDESSVVTDPMVAALAQKFLTPGGSNDIYDLTTNIYGEEWFSSPHTDAMFIQPDDNITILLYDILMFDNNVLGYFWSKDNYKNGKTPYPSNERIMFYLDAPIFAESSGTWSIADSGPAEIISTLAHEFQHMIHFYQKSVVRGATNSEAWLDELCSMATEDLLAVSMQVDGPRGVSYASYGLSAGGSDNSWGRIPYYNYYTNKSLMDWQSTDQDYSVNYVFGAYLTRNFGGPQVLRNIVQNAYPDYRAIVYAVEQAGYNYDIGTILRRWGVALLLSNLVDDAPYDLGDQRYNNGATGFSNTLGTVTYSFGSINLFNYRQQTGVYYNRLYDTYYAGYNEENGSYVHGPRIHTEASAMGTLAPGTNSFFKAAENLTGSKTWKITISSNTRLTVLVRN